ncbi:MAG TPA: hypothetical protein VHD85_02545 [Terracidiphilus sp.]|nr:hypothetical protein [Terracidiphilus sp.]
MNVNSEDDECADDDGDGKKEGKIVSKFEGSTFDEALSAANTAGANCRFEVHGLGSYSEPTLPTIPGNEFYASKAALSVRSS